MKIVLAKPSRLGYALPVTKKTLNEMIQRELTAIMRANGSKGGNAKTQAKQDAARVNGSKGGRPSNKERLARLLEEYPAPDGCAFWPVYLSDFLRASDRPAAPTRAHYRAWYKVQQVLSASALG
jgi:hypothetical protein